MLFITLLLVNFAYICMSLNQLSFSGGGSFGAIEIGILKRILENENENHQNNNKKYDLYTGISAGSLNAGFLSYFKDIKDGVKIPSCWTKTEIKGLIKIKNINEWNNRLDVLKNEIKYWINPNNKTHKIIHVVELFFDN